MSRAPRGGGAALGRSSVAVLARPAGGGGEGGGGAGWSFIVLAPASGDGPSWTLVETRSLSDADLSTVPALCRAAGVSRLVRIAPMAHAVVRCVRIPAGSDAELASAVGLIAEAELPQSAPVWRRCGGILPDTLVSGSVRNGNNDRWALLTGWIGDTPEPPLDPELDEAWVSPVAVLAALRGESAIAAWCDRAQGVIAVVAGDGERLSARVARGDAETEASWSQSVRDAMAEAAEFGKASGVGLAVNARGLMLSAQATADLRQAVRGVRDEDDFVQRFMPAVGAGLIAGASALSVRSLAGLRGGPPVVRRSGLERAASWIVNPRHAWGVVAAALVVLMVAPLAFAWARGEVLSSKAAVLEKTKGGREEAERRAALYQQLDRDRWPMTKLLGEISRASPVGVVATNLRLTTEQGLNFQGTAESSDLVNTLSANLNATGLFRSVRVERVESKGAAGVEFTLSGELSSPFSAAKGLTADFAAKPLAVQLYGEGASNTTTAAPAAKAGAGGGARRGSDASSERKPAAAPEGPPPPLSDADIAKMDRSKAMTEWSSRKKYRQSTPGLEAATRDRLDAEIPKLLQRMQEALKDPKSDAKSGGSK